MVCQCLADLASRRREQTIESRSPDPPHEGDTGPTFRASSDRSTPRALAVHALHIMLDLTLAVLGAHTIPQIAKRVSDHRSPGTSSTRLLHNNSKQELAGRSARSTEFTLTSG